MQAMTARNKKWHIHTPADPGYVQSLPEHPLLMQVLYNRGARTPAAARAFLNGSDAMTVDPFRLRDMEPAVQRIVRAIELGETICVYGDFDADGVAATTLLVLALQAAGGKVGPYIPDRVDEGYGLNADAIRQIAARAQVMVTVDCGIRSVEEVQIATGLGLDVIVTDHHSVGPHLPPALAVINPRRKDCLSKFDRLAGVGVAYRLAQGVLRVVAEQKWSRINADRALEIEESLLDLVALGTVADMMPLLDDNRWLVQRGLAQMNKEPRPGLAALMAQSDLRAGSVDATAISFRLGPRINAAGRLDHAKRAYQLLRAVDATQAYMLASELEELNNRRKSMTEKAVTEAEHQLVQQLENNAALLAVRSPTIPSGIVGLVAGRIVERHYRPCIVVEEGKDESRGSARSIAELDISRALDEVGGWLIRHGGHARAAGFTVKTERLEDFVQALGHVAAGLLPDRSDLRPTLEIDAVVKFEEINWAVLEQFARLQPCGHENAPPQLLCAGVRVREARRMGSGKHMRLIVDNGPASVVLDAVGFQMGDWCDRLGEGSHVDLVFYLEVNEWQGRKRLQLNLQDLRLAD
jgi:single-stranded-DNA-specific exonuclease